MSTAILKYVLGAGVSCALALSFANPSNAFPALTNTATVKSLMPSLVTDARYYGRGYGGRYYGRSYRYGGVQSVRLSAVQFSAGCSQRLTIMGAAPITI